MKKIAVAISGGIDSTATLIKLKDKGHDVIGLTMLLSDYSKTQDYKTAKSICDELNVKHYSIDLSKTFKTKIIDYFINEYLSARTPNPCLFCNPIIKFGILKEYAEKLGYSIIATGHYVRLVYKNQKLYIKKGIDEKKEQSYFVSRIFPQILSKVMFPIGELTKEQVKAYLKDKGYNIRKNKESQEICFIPHNDYKLFIRDNINKDKFIKGDILDENGNRVGTHNGLPLYTIGQRRGINVAMGKPVYVRELVKKNNTIIIGERKKTRRFEAINPVWHYSYNEVKDSVLEVKIRYRGKPQKCRIIDQYDNRIIVEFEKEVSSVTPGQGAVFYLDDIVAVSAIIDRVF
jgi:tRNA-uridine 2-sulfurtransferase